jgi:hypothetical protein
MKNKINKAITRKLDKKFDEKFWQKFDSENSQTELKVESPWKQFIRPVMISSVLIVLTFNLYSRFSDYNSNEFLLTDQEIEEILDETMQVDEIVSSISLEIDNEFYVLND